jgi:sugar lactone lactonase YvrE
MSVTAPPDLPRATDVEALIEAARRRQRRRRLLIAALLSGALLAAVVASLIRHGAASAPSPAAHGSRQSAAARNGADIRLERPGALALGPGGDLYIADDGRNQILRRLANGRFQVVAGTGKAGFSGDGGPAAHAELNEPGGIALGRDGTLYVADQGNNRIRAIAPNGVISTVAGNGKGGWVKNGTPAHRATILSPPAVAIGPHGRLYIPTGWNQVLRLERSGTLTQIAGSRKYAGVRPFDAGRPAVNESPADPSALAFDRAGNLYLAGWAVKTLLMITPGGILTRPDGIGGFYPRGFGDLVTAPNGSVYAANSEIIVRLSPHRMKTVVDFSAQRFSGIRGFLPEGIAVARNGDIYADTWRGNGYANAAALIEVRPGHHPHVLWKQ